MIHLLEGGDEDSISKPQVNQAIISRSQTNSQHDNPPLYQLLTRLNIPISCANNEQIRQHYLEEYSAKYSKAKHLLSNARKKQRKIIMTYYEAKEKQDNINELQAVKESLLEENEKIKRFKEALKDKLIVYHQRIQFLKDTEFWSTFEIQQLQNDATDSMPTYTENSSADSPTIADSRHLLEDRHILDDSFPTLSNEDHSKQKSNRDDFLPIIDNVISRLTEYREQSSDELISTTDENIESTVSKKKKNDYFQWLNAFISFFTPDDQLDRYKITNTILIISLAVFLVVCLNDLLEQFLIYLTKPSGSMTRLSPSNSMLKLFSTYLLSPIYNYTTSWLLSFARIFDFSV